MRDVLSCGECGSRRLSGTPDEGFLCIDCGRFDRCDFESREEWGNPHEHQGGGWASFDPRFDGNREEADSPRQTANSPGSGSPPDPSRAPRADPHSHLRCACCFALTGRCRRQAHKCCVVCRCSYPPS